MQYRSISMMILVATLALTVGQDAAPQDHARLYQQEKSQLQNSPAAKLFPPALFQKLEALETQSKQATDPAKAQLLMQQARWLLPESQSSLPPHVSKVMGTLKFKHDQYPMAAVYARDGQSLFTAGRDGSVKHWNLQNGNTLKSWQFDQPLSAMALSPNGQFLAVAEGYRLSPSLDLAALPTLEDYNIHVIELATGQVKWKLTGSKSAYLCLAFSPDSQLLASGGQYVRAETLRIWNMATGKLDRSFKPVHPILQLAWAKDASKLYAVTGDRSFCTFDAISGLQMNPIRERGMIYALALSPDEKILAVGGDITDDNSANIIKLYSTSDWKVSQVITGHTSAVTSLAFHSSGDTLISASAKPEAAIKIWDVKRRTAVTQYVGHTSDVLAIALPPAGQNIATVSLDGSIRLWQTTQVRAPRPLVKAKGAIWTVAAHGNRILTVGADQSAAIWDAETGKELKRFTEHHAPVTAGAFRPDGLEVATGGGDFTIRLWDPATGQAGRTLTGHTGVITALAYSPDGKRLYSASADKTIRFWNLADGKSTVKLEQHRSVVTSLALNLDGSLLATGGADNIIRIWRTHDGSELRSLIGHSGAITGLAFSPGGMLLASVGADGITKIWEPATRGDALRTFSGHTGQLMAVAFSPNLKFLATAGADETIRVWNLSSGSEARALKGHTDWITSLTFLGEGDTLASASVDGSVLLWSEAKTFEPLIFGHEHPIRYLAISSNGERLASGSEEGKIILWDAATGNELASLNGHQSAIKALSFSHDSKRLISADRDVVVKLWDVDAAKELQSLQSKSDGINRLAFLAGDRGIAASIGASNISLWAFDQKQLKPEPALTFLGYERHCNSVAFAVDRVALGATDGIVKLWKLNQFKHETDESIKAYPVAVLELTLSTDGKRLLTCNQENEFKLWNIDDKKLLHTWQTRPHRLSAFALNPQGDLAMAAFDNGEVVLWNATNGKELRTWKFHGPMTDLIFSPDNKHAYSASSHFVIYQLDLP